VPPPEAGRELPGSPGAEGVPGAGRAALRGLLLVSHRDTHAVSFINPDGPKTVALVSVGWDPREIAVSPDGGTAYVTNYGGATLGATISVVSIPSRSESHRIDLSQWPQPHGMAISRSGVFLYVLSGGALLQINLLSEQIERKFALHGSEPWRLALAADESRVYVANAGSGTVSAVDLATGAVSEGRVGTRPVDVAASPDGLTLWVANRSDGTVSVLDPFTLESRGNLIAGRAPTRIVFTADGRRAAVVNSGEASVAVFDVASRARLGSIALGFYPLAVAVEPDGRHAYLAAPRGNTITRVDLETLQVVERFPVARFPTEMAWVPLR